jgi:hypothetical protein
MGAALLVGCTIDKCRKFRTRACFIFFLGHAKAELILHVGLKQASWLAGDGYDRSDRIVKIPAVMLF